MYMYKFPVLMYVCYDCESARRDIMNKITFIAFVC